MATKREDGVTVTETKDSLSRTTHVSYVSDKISPELRAATEAAKKAFFVLDRAPTPPDQLTGIAARMQSGFDFPDEPGRAEACELTANPHEVERTRAARRWAHGVKPKPENPGSLNLIRKERERQAVEKDKENGRG